MMSHDKPSDSKGVLDLLGIKPGEQDCLQQRQTCFDILDFIGIGVAIIDRNMKILSTNKYLKDRFPHIMGAEHTFCYQTFNVPPRTSHCINCPTLKVFKTGELSEAIIPTPTPEGQLHLRIISSPIFNQVGEVTSVIEIVEDITEKHQTKLKLDAANQRFQDVALACNDFLWEIDCEGRFLYVSDNITTVTGYSSQELLGYHFFDFVIEGGREQAQSEFNQHLNNLDPLTAQEYWIVHRDGSSFCIQVNGVPFFDDTDRCLGYRGTSTNITAHKDYESKLAASEKKFKSISESAKDAIIMMGPDGNISFWNQAAQDVFGYTEEEALGQNLHHLLAPPDYQEEQKKYPFTAIEAVQCYSSGLVVIDG